MARAKLPHRPASHSVIATRFFMLAARIPVGTEIELNRTVRGA